ncbi:hypothetical protein [Apilactobacillus apinorum]|uniref:Uncharacterized protein n=1 Tax=Apilactobacillus apinorum TaxID=1218495 RepID=A0ABP9ZH66_9LACO
MKSTFSKVLFVIVLLFIAFIAAISIATHNSNVDNTLKAVNQTVAVNKKKHHVGDYELEPNKDEIDQYSFPRLDAIKSTKFKKGEKIKATKLVQDQQTSFYQINKNTYVLSTDVTVVK